MIKLNDVLSLNLAERLRALCSDVVFGKVKNFDIATKTNYSWDYDLVLDSAPVLCLSIPKYLAEDLEKELCSKNILNLEKDESIIDSAMLYVWFKNSFIAPHSDTGYSKAITIYLTSDWKPTDGGFFIFKSLNTGNWECIAPDFNTGVLNDDNAIHLVTPIQSSQKFRITVQIFIKPKKKMPTYLEFSK